MRRWRQRTLSLSAVGALAALSLPAFATSGAAAPGFAATRAAAEASWSARGAVVLLPTGETARVLPTTGSRSRTVITSRVPGGAHTLENLVGGGKRYLIPDTAVPYLGGRLDRTLFDTALLPTGTAGVRIPVRVSYTTAGAPAVPGVTYTSTGVGVASGYLTAAGARQFGVALAKKFAADAAARSFSGTTLFGATAIRSTASSGVVTPKLPMRTVIITATDGKGQPALGSVIAMRTDAGAAYIAFGELVGGQTRLSLPVGHIALLGNLFSLGTDGSVTKVSVVVTTDYTVSTQNQVARLDAAAATTRFTAPTTPRPADVVGGDLGLAISSADGMNNLGADLFVDGQIPVWVSPAAPAVNGTLTATRSWALQNTSGGYGYQLAFGLEGRNNGIPAALADQVTTSDLATLDNRFVTDVARQAGFFALPVTATGGPGGTGLNVSLPGTLTVYVNPPAGAVYPAEVFAWDDVATPPYIIDDAARPVSPGAVLSADWGRGPLVSNVPVDFGGLSSIGFPWACPACRTDTSLLVSLAPTTDSTPGHGVATFTDPSGTPVGRFRVYENGTQLFDGADVAGAVLTLTASATPKTYRILDEVNRVPSGAVQSTSTITDLTFVSAAGSGAALPSGWQCDLGAGCRVLPLLRAAVALPVDGLGRVPVGTSTIGLTLAHIQGAATPAVSGGTVEIRRPGGAWTTLPVTDAGGGLYRASLTTTGADVGTLIDLRVSGRDAAGGLISQTAVAAFGVTG